MTQTRIFAQADVKKRASRTACWVTSENNVYDITPFMDDHPGGEAFLLQYAGRDLEDVMTDKFWHEHSPSAFEMLEEFKIGVLVQGESTVSDDWVPDENFHPDETNTKADFDKNKFLDLSKPLLAQVWGAPWSKEYYLEQVHNPRHLKESARLFGWDFLEAFTRTKWYVVPLFWGPITGFLFYLSLLQFTDSSIVAGDILQWPLPRLPTVASSAFAKTIPCFLLGNLIWTLLEYGLHRFLFHVDHYLPDRNWALMLHFLLHGVHHYLPMDRLRLVMPPLLFFVLETPFTRLAHLIFPKAMANGIIAGAFTFYILYDCMHYALHHTRLPQYLTEMKRYHLAHHYKNFELGFGVTSKLWDWCFNTLLV
ncbi:fatty acid alpha-hydroxylase [Vanrija albida]|uniref:Ceramide very long chain fatty acid hydroxylase n=1 Tax=Vanrija albida TaxID=181172 RepID=A0ABR3QEW0_9TREE